MKNLYLDTNIFIYASDKKSPFYTICHRLIKFCKTNNIRLSTSSETFQEIIHFSKNIKQLPLGVKIAKNTLKIVDQIYPISETTIRIYLEQVQKYPTRKSRDILHLSSCIENKIDILISYDQNFDIFKQLKTLEPEEIYEIL